VKPHEIILLALGALFGVGGTIAGVAVPLLYLNTPPSMWHWAFWGGIALMILVVINTTLLLLLHPQLTAALLFNVGMVLVAFAAILQWSPRASPPTVSDKQSVQVLLGTGAPYETVEQAGLNRSRTVRVKIENNTNSEISNGKLEILNLDPPKNGNKDWLLKDGITIGPHKHTFVGVAAYNEGTSQAPVGTWIRLLVPMPSGFFAEAMPNLPVVPHTFHLKFSTLEGGLFDEVYCGLFVDQHHILHSKIEETLQTSTANQRMVRLS
jgi:hypothetical protein